MQLSCRIVGKVEVLCDPWAILVLRDIMFGNRRHFRELVAGSEEGIAINEERAELWPQITSVFEGYARYQERTERPIPVIILEPK
jgi:hypothetical protein